MTEAQVQLWQLSNSSSNLAITAQLHQQRSSLQQSQLRQLYSLAALQPCSRATMQPCSLAAVQPCTLVIPMTASAPQIPITALLPSHQPTAQSTNILPKKRALQLQSLYT